MKLFGTKRIRRRDIRKVVWFSITAVSALAMIIATAAPAFRK